MIGLLQNKAVGPGLQTPDRKGLDNGTLSEPSIQTPPPSGTESRGHASGRCY